MPHATIVLKDNIKPVKHSVRFDTDQENPIVTGIYVNRKQAKKLLGVDLEKIEGIEVTIRAIKGKPKKSEEEEE